MPVLPKHVIEKLKSISPADLEEMVDRLANYGGLGPELKHKIISPIGLNLVSRVTRKGQPDAKIFSEGICIQYSRSRTLSKIKKDIDVLKSHKPKQYYFVTVGNIKNDAEDEIALIDCVSEYAAQAFGNQVSDNHFIGIDELAIPLCNPNFSFLRRDYLKINEDYFQSAKSFIDLHSGEEITQLNPDLLEIVTNDIKGFLDGTENIVFLRADIADVNWLELTVAVGCNRIEGLDEYKDKYRFAVNKRAANASDYCYEVQSEEIKTVAVFRNLILRDGNANLTALADFISTVRESGGNKVIVVISSQEEEEIKQSWYTSLGSPEIKFYSKQINEPATAVTSDEITRYESLEAELQNDFINNARFLQAIIYLAKPFSLQSISLRQAWREMLGIDENEELSIINNLLNKGILMRAGDYILFRNENIGKYLLEEVFFTADSKYQLDDILEKLNLYEGTT